MTTQNGENCQVRSCEEKAVVIKEMELTYITKEGWDIEMWLPVRLCLTHLREIGITE